MVSYYVVSEYSLTSPITGGGEKIPNGPLYALERVKAIAHDGTGLALWTRDCVKNVHELGWDADQVAVLIQQLCDADYLDSEWCQNGQGAWAGCDAYAVRVTEWVPTAQKEMRMEYFLKFAISKTGALVLTVSCHI